MMKRWGIVFGLLVCMPVMAARADDGNAADTAATAGTLDLNVRRIGIDWSKTEVVHAEQYADSPIQALRATSQDYIKAITDVLLAYKKNKFNWDNSLFMEYGKTRLKPYDGPSTTDENADKILLSSDLSYACWEFSGFKFGPTVGAQYQTDFAGDPHQNIIRGNGGISLFDHPIIKTLYLGGLYEYDFTYAGDQTSKLGGEFGWRLEYEIRDGVRVSTNGYYREYFSYSKYVATDLDRDLNAVLRMDTNLWGDFTFGPYVQYRLAKARGVDVYGSNLVVGLSFNYITKFGLL